MRIDCNFDAGVTSLMVSGDIDMATAGELRQAGEDAITDVTGTLRIDLSAVTFMDSSGVGALVAIRNATVDSATLILDNPSPRVLRVLELTGLLHTFAIEPTPQARPDHHASPAAFLVLDLDK
jgi:anti-sigma B factor antagonist